MAGDLQKTDFDLIALSRNAVGNEVSIFGVEFETFWKKLWFSVKMQHFEGKTAFNKKFSNFDHKIIQSNLP